MEEWWNAAIHNWVDDLLRLLEVGAFEGWHTYVAFSQECEKLRVGIAQRGVLVPL